MPERPHEFELIAELFAPLATSEAALGLVDDVALLQLQNDCDLAVTTDALVEGVHFFPTDPPETVAKKVLRQNLSDIAAKGAEPCGYLMALSLPDHISLEWLRSFCNGLREDQERFNLSLLGGDTTRTTGPLSVAVTALGSVPRGQLIRRSGARPGDLVFVSGTIGDAGEGLAVLKAGKQTGDAWLINRYRVPQPRLSLGRALRGVASAALDVSDGLLADLGHIASTSGIRIRVDIECVPLSTAFRNTCGDIEAAIVRAATAGDDFEIAFTARSAAAVEDAARRVGTPVTRIGNVEPGVGVVLCRPDGSVVPTPKLGFEHF